jgi:hypothetical protein
MVLSQTEHLSVGGKELCWFSLFLSVSTMWLQSHFKIICHCQCQIFNGNSCQQNHFEIKAEPMITALLFGIDNIFQKCIIHTQYKLLA